MFERFTRQARQVVVSAQQEARGLRHPAIGPEHLLLGLAAEHYGTAGRILQSQGLRIDDLRRVVTERSLSAPDAGALRAIGIDLDAVRAKVEEAFGPGALERRELRPGRRRGHRHVPFTREAKKALELALREALRLRSTAIGTEHVLLGLLRADGTLAADLLREAGVTRALVEAHLLDEAASG